MADISIEEIVELKEKGMTDAKISEYFSAQGNRISTTTVHNRLTRYYNLNGKTKPRGKSISDEELAIMKEEKKSDREIAEYFTKQGRKICLGSVNRRLSKHYKSKKTKKPRARVKYEVLKKDISNDEILVLRKQGLSFRAIAEHFKSLGKQISHATIEQRIKRIYELQKLEKDEKKEFKDSLKVSNIPTIKVPQTKSNTNFVRDNEER